MRLLVLIKVFFSILYNNIIKNIILLSFLTNFIDILTGFAVY